ncbi:unnamed protein product [Blepharisma stoltei]|uniref:Uncharacterized protein n=1 Tax=Blepharisma stoltei TaxID=1481888 RepID=A0AAU9JU34_9CILI|nr:unnamed protein product [Blepharisma stoltei]
MEIEVTILRADFKRDSGWFLQIELEEKSYPSKETKKQKQRTELAYGSDPRFERHFFTFTTSLANRISLRFGAVEATDIKSSASPHLDTKGIDPKKCTCQGVYTLVITQRKLANLRDQVPMREIYKLLHPTTKEEGCILTVSIAFNIHGIEEQIIENERVLQKVEFDRYENDPMVIKEKLLKTEELCEAKNKELAEWMGKTDSIKNALRSLGVDLAMLKKQKDSLEEENEKMAKEIKKRQNIEDIHIKVDMLSNSVPGIGLLKQEYEKLNLRLKVEKMIYEELTQDWMKIEGKKRKLEQLKEEVEKMKNAQKELEFHMHVLADRLPESLVTRENVRALDVIIKQFEAQIAKGRSQKRDRALELEVEELRHRKALNTEKFKQVQLILEENDGFLPMEEYKRLKIDEEESTPELEQIRNRGNELLKEIEQLGAQLSNDTVTGPGEGNLIQMQVQLQAAEARVAAMQERMDEQASAHAKEVAMMAAKIAELDAIIEYQRPSYQ